MRHLLTSAEFSAKIRYVFRKLSNMFLLCFVFCFFSCADKIPEKAGFKALNLYSYGKDSETLSLSESTPATYLYYYIKDEDFEKSTLSQTGIVPSSFVVNFVPAQEENEVLVAFLFASDFTKGKLNSKLPARPVAKCTLAAGKKTRVSLAFPADGTKIKGFFIQSAGNATIDDVSIENTIVGWHLSESEVYWGLGPDGGSSSALRNLTGSGSMTVDLSSARSLGADVRAVSSQGTGSSAGITLREYVKVYFRDNPADAGENGNQGTLDIYSGATRFRIRRSPEPQTETFYAPYLFAPSLPQDAVGSQNAVAAQNAASGKEYVLNVADNADMITGIEYVYVPSESAFSEKGERLPYAITADLGCIISWPSMLWQRKDFELFRWNMFPNILLFDFADYKIQDDYLKRLAFYVEKAGYRGKLWADKDIKNLHGYNAHDYRAESLAQFYEVARTQNFKLNDSEYLLRDILLLYGIIRRNSDGSYAPGDGGIISISKESNESLREKLLAHESYHGIYFCDASFRQKTTDICSVMDQQSLLFIKQYFASQPSLGYDLNDSYLIENEVMAYIMQQSVKAQSWYFADDLAWRGTVMKYMPDLASYIRSTKAAGITEAAVMFDDYVFARWGLNAGRTSMISVSR